DVATTEVPTRVVELARRAGLEVHPTGLDHGTVTVVAKDGDEPKAFEVTTLRIDVETFGRHAQVAFTDDWTADARRRDFTMNALYCDGAGTVFDPVDGFPDILERRVRFVGEPQERIREDFLRILRFFRFQARYGQGDPDVEGLTACVALQEGLETLSAERVRQEMLKLLVGLGAVPVLRTMAETGIAARILPTGHDLARFSRMARIDSEQRLEPDPVLRLAAIGLASPDDAATLRRSLRLFNAEHGRLQHLAQSVPPTPALRDNERRIVLYQMGPNGYRDAVRFAWSTDQSAFATDDWAELLRLPEHWTVPRFPVSGSDLASRGVPAGPDMGRLLMRLEDWWMAAGFPADKQAVLDQLDTLGVRQS
ncbi:MAG TPA: CCA tRNA nucleotidyltransferase, partial [Aestuariivirgaceae bacterium]|nr:CCA tRNA nucleotidyltransferase [Aestuariivirgaceae bacterium]